MLKFGRLLFLFFCSNFFLSNLFSVCCGVCLQFTKCTVWPRNPNIPSLSLKQNLIKKTFHYSKVFLLAIRSLFCHFINRISDFLVNLFFSVASVFARYFNGKNNLLKFLLHFFVTDLNVP